MSFYCYYCNYNFSSADELFKCIGCGRIVEVEKCSCWEYADGDLIDVGLKNVDDGEYDQ